MYSGRFNIAFSLLGMKGKNSYIVRVIMSCVVILCDN